MKKWLLLALMVMCLVFSCAYAENADDKVIIYFQDGSMVLLPAEIADDEQKLAEYCDQYFPGRFYTRDADAATVQYDASVSVAWAVEQYGEGARAMSVRLVKLGIHTSVVANTKGEELIVPTAELTIRGFEDKEHHVAVISAPRTGEASLREKAAGNGKVLAKCEAGRIVAVVEYSNAVYTKIVYGEHEGYIRTDCLIFQDTGKAPLGSGVVHIKGATDGQSEVVIRNDASKSAAKVTEIPTGTQVSIFASVGEWAAVEWNGNFGYIQEQYIEMNQQ